jgi:hypothetical protein
MAKLGGKVREVLDKNGFNHVQLSGYEHNWSKLTKYSNALVRLFHIHFRCLN